jgi:hypothetical protein
MASRRDYYYRQLVTEAELDAGFDGLEQADRNMMVDKSYVGVFSLGVVSQHAGSPNLTVDVSGPAVAYDQQGQRILIPSTQTQNVAVDDSSVSTSVGAPGNEKWVSLIVKFTRLLSDPRTDGNSNTVYFVRSESFIFSVIQGAEAAIGVASRPTLPPDGLLLADIHRLNAQTQIFNADISTTRRMDNFVVSGSPHAIRRGLVKDVFSDLLGWFNDHVLGNADKHNADKIVYAGGGTWADGGTNPTTDTEAQLDKIISDLASTSGSGADKIGLKARTVWLGGRTNPAGTLFAGIDKIITDLAATAAGDDGAERIGAEAVSGFSAGSVRSQLTELGPAVAGTAFSATKTFNGNGDTNAALATTTQPTARKCLWEFQVNATVKGRLYANLTSSRIEFTLNAQWNGTDYTRDNTGANSMRAQICSLNGILSWEYKAAAAGTFSAFDGAISLSVPAAATTLVIGADGVTGASGAQDGIVAYCGDASGAMTVGGSSTFRAKFQSAPSSVSYSSSGLPADVNITTAFAQANTTFTTSGLFVTAATTGAGAAKHVRTYSVS